MKPYAYLAQWACLLLVGMGPLRGKSAVREAETKYDAIDAYITARMRTDRIPGVAVAIVEGDEIVYLKGYGRADAAGRPVTPQTPFLIGSITKAVTALAVMQLVDTGLVELDAPVQRYLPWFRVRDPVAAAQITVRMLIEQTSGLAQAPTMVTWTWPDEPEAMERHVRLLADTDLVFAPGQGFAYSNGNFVTLGVIVQAVSGQSYDDYLRAHIFEPLDMQHSYTSQAAAMQAGMAVGHRWWLGYPIPATLPFNRANLPAGFAIASAEDMAHFLVAQLNGGSYEGRSVLSPESLALMHAEPPPGTYGLGWESVRIGGHRLINFDGATGNFQASVFIDPAARVGVFVAANVMCALDGLSSSRSSSSLGATSAQELARRLLDPDERNTLLFSALITTRGMAHSVLNMAADRPLPSQGPGQRQIALILSLVLLALTGLLVLSLVRVPDWYGQLALQGMAGWPELGWRTGLTALLHFSLPLTLLYVSLRVPYWNIIVIYQPDVVLWLKAVAAVVAVKGLLEIALLWRVFGQG